MRRSESQARRNSNAEKSGKLDLQIVRAADDRAEQELLTLLYEYELYSSGFALLLTKLPKGSWLRNFLTDRLTNRYMRKATRKIVAYKLMKQRIEDNKK